MKPLRLPIDRPPRIYWLLPLVIGVLRTAPFIWSLFTAPPEGSAVVQVGYIPADFLSYVAFIRQVGEEGSFALHNPFTTEAHPGRFLLLLHWLLGVVVAVTGMSPTWVLELSRIPLTFVFFAVLWWFLSDIFADRTDRCWAAALIGLSGGIEGFLKPLTWMVSEFPRTRFTEGVWHLYGWNTFESLYNPLWIAGLCVLLVVLRPALRPTGPRRGEWCLVTVGLPVLFLIHPYSALAALAVIVAQPIGEWILSREPIEWRKYVRIGGALVVPVLLLAAVSLWQRGDPVYRAASGNVWGQLQLAVFWYPLTLGAVGVLAIRGTAHWFSERHPYRFAVLAWVGAVVLMHTSPVLNGYHFVFYLHLPICLLSVPAARAAWRRVTDGDRRGAFGGLGLLGASFASFLLVSAESIGDIQRRNCVPSSYVQTIDALRSEPTGNILGPPELGNLIPAYTPHRVWVGHWFLTPDYHDKVAGYDQFVAGKSADALVREIDRAEINYIVVPRDSADTLADTLGVRVRRRTTCGDLDVFCLTPTSTVASSEVR